MRILIKYTLEGIDIYNIKLKDVAEYLKNRGVENFRYNENEDYGDIICLIFEYLSENSICY